MRFWSAWIFQHSWILDTWSGIFPASALWYTFLGRNKRELQQIIFIIVQLGVYMMCLTMITTWERSTSLKDMIMKKKYQLWCSGKTDNHWTDLKDDRKCYAHKDGVATMAGSSTTND